MASAHFQYEGPWLSSVWGGLDQTAPQVLHITVRWPLRPGTQLQGLQPISAFGGTSLCPFTQIFGNHSASERMIE
jgi:hypothetical protein